MARPVKPKEIPVEDRLHEVDEPKAEIKVKKIENKFSDLNIPLDNSDTVVIK